MDFSLQDIGVGANSFVADNSGPNNTFNWSQAIGGLTIGIARSAADVGLATLAKSQGVTAAPVNPYLGNGSLVVPPRQSSALFAGKLGSTGGTAVMVGAFGLVGLGLLLWAALRKG